MPRTIDRRVFYVVAWALFIVVFGLLTGWLSTVVFAVIAALCAFVYRRLHTAPTERIRQRARAASSAAGTLDVPDGMRVAPAGWYSDPTGDARRRYFDGSAWTERTR